MRLFLFVQLLAAFTANCDLVPFSLRPQHPITEKARTEQTLRQESASQYLDTSHDISYAGIFPSMCSSTTSRVTSYPTSACAMRMQNNKRRPAAWSNAVADIEASANGCGDLGTKDSSLNLSRAALSRMVMAYPCAKLCV